VVEILVGVVILAGAARYAVRDARRRREADAPYRAEPEYSQEVQARSEPGTKSQSSEDSEASEVLEERHGLDIRQLDAAARDRYTQRWEAVRAEFVDQPGPALDAADQLVVEVMRERGYPVDDFDEHAELVAAEYPQVVEHYRAARTVRHGQPEAADAEDLQQAFEHYGTLFDELVHDRQATRS
ncbi:MAG: hypothetical protein ACRDTT_27105, partial [Pseudonocardiaceae bacterium]